LPHRSRRYDSLVRKLVLTAIGDDRAGLVSALADVITSHGGNWEASQMAELAGKFAGIVVVSVPRERADALVAALRTLNGLLEVSVYEGAGEGVGETADWNRITLDILGNDHPGIVHEISSVLSARGLSIDTMTTGTREAPMAGGVLFEAHLTVLVPTTIELADVREDLEHVAAELLVEMSIDEV
jgi:glycine cleavage system regulatory protein